MLFEVRRRLIAKKCNNSMKKVDVQIVISFSGLPFILGGIQPKRNISTKQVYMYKRYNREIRRRVILGGLFSLLPQVGHFLSCTKISLTKCYKQSDTLLQLILHVLLNGVVQF